MSLCFCVPVSCLHPHPPPTPELAPEASSRQNPPQLPSPSWQISPILTPTLRCSPSPWLPLLLNRELFPACERDPSSSQHPSSSLGLAQSGAQNVFDSVNKYTDEKEERRCKMKEMGKLSGGALGVACSCPEAAGLCTVSPSLCNSGPAAPLPFFP